MKLKNSFFYTIRENIKDEDSVSGNLLVRSGMIKKTSSGIYMYLPLGLKVLNNIEKIVREEMNKINAEEVLMPSLISEDVYAESNRLSSFGDAMFKLKDRYDKNYVFDIAARVAFKLPVSRTWFANSGVSSNRLRFKSAGSP